MVLISFRQRRKMHPLAQEALERIKLKSTYFVDVQVWPLPTELNTDAWLGNFTEEDLPYAALLLDSFLYLPPRMVDALFLSAIQGVSQQFADRHFAAARDRWTALLNNAIFCAVTGEEPNPTDSGYLFARKLRQVVGVPEERVAEPATCIEILEQGLARAVFFIDDFVGSGNQFLTLWRREYGNGTSRMSFERLAKKRPELRMHYCPLIATADGARTLQDECGHLVLHPAHILDPRSGPLHSQSSAFPEELRDAAQTMIKRVSLALGIPDTDGRDPEDWQGYRKQGCALAFAHGIPDATLPIFYWEKNWKPLLRRT